jgi:hypothetical protein
MICKIKLFISFFILSLSFTSMYSKASTCPSVESIKRVQSEYLWVTSIPGWNGFFVAPKTGKGHSYKINKFLGASWVKAHDTQDSSGFVQCDYSGEFVEITELPNPKYAEDPATEPKTLEIAMNEVIRFVQTNSYAAVITQEASQNWTCLPIIKFPDVACNCFTDIEKCSFKLV